VVRAVGALLALLVVIALVAGAWRALPILSIGAGLKAGHMCSAVFVAGRSPEAVLRDELSGLHPGLRLVPDPLVDRGSRSVAVPLAFGLMVRRASYREGVGCTVLPPGGSIEELAALPGGEIPHPPGDPALIPWPDGDLLPTHALPPVVDRQRLRAAV
jgi:hypothetical protein